MYAKRCIIKQIVLVLDYDWPSHIQSPCKILYKHTPVTALQQHFYIKQIVSKKCVVNFDLLGALRLNEWWTKINRMEEENKK